jgi:hypothetical protein
MILLSTLVQKGISNRVLVYKPSQAPSPLPYREELPSLRASILVIKMNFSESKE